MKFDIEDFHKNIGRFTRRPSYILLLLVTLGRYKSALFE